MRTLEIKSLPPKAWVDKDEIMLHACFQVLDDFMVNESEHIHPEYHADELREFNELLNWWKKRSKRSYSESKTEDKDEAMLGRLIRIRKRLWT